MPKAEFDKVLQVHGRTASVQGPLTPEERGPRASLPVHVHWALVQGNEIAAGVGDARPDGTWGSQDVAQHVWTDGPAHAAGVIITILTEPTDAEPIVEMFTWSQRVTLEVS